MQLNRNLLVRKLDPPQTWVGFDVSRDAQPLDTEESIRRYIRCQIFCLLGSTLFTDKSTAYAHAKYLPLLRDFERIHTYSWGSACLAHLYRALCLAS
ncbi:hypothetical protein Ahy_A02g007072 [Arachis hypogaea]|uniref:Aminotransferase-like plant mobile domain-containing protein n=1 Tax=Arachis hypogaea TaxID=3818 RepID=A0A445EBE5_ARAHY|nr:hypothetical protein Ahy_A02g007072 [Arachis hypogaea]